ncbi:hypothetical protein LJB81_02890 [Desulfovibrio sp. OttesenSCG-928-M14]|nr:hypothetical protein [Desulfovibrio sp. OttesenSCG-928-M14]
MHLDIVYDYDNIAYNGVLMTEPGRSLRLGNFAAANVVLREVSLYKEGHCSTKYGQTVLPGYRKILHIEKGIFDYTPTFAGGVEKVLIEISEYWS